GATLTVNKSATVQSYGQVANASDDLFPATDCAQDNHTGLVWEVKTSSGTRAVNDVYTNYDGTGIGQKADGSNATPTEINASTNSIGYVNTVNAGSGLCGFTDWRMPTEDELYGLRDESQPTAPAINQQWFANTKIVSAYWSSTPGTFSSLAWIVPFNLGAISTGNGTRTGYQYFIRLVRCSNGAATCP
ncbi:MAG: DUF1566 domain-containing protein, partial [Rhodoferax sp.]|nr:DUF1566 domain-containing protein [Rhodoferax sp.]